MKEKKVFGLIGKQLAHSFSKQYFEEKFETENIIDCSYELFSLNSIEDLPAIIETNPNLVGLNVTIPYKETVIPFLNELSNEAKAIGAVNTIKITRENNKTVLKGFNTDAFGFKRSIKPFLKSHHERALILGTGGSAKAISYVLNNIGIDTLFVSRNPTGNQISYEQVNQYVLNFHYLIVNCTPLGMFPNEQTYPQIPFEHLTEKHTLLDLVYNPAETLFLKKGKSNKSKTFNGLSMLHQQAEEAWRVWK